MLLREIVSAVTSPASDQASERHHLVVPIGVIMIVLQLCHRAWALATGYFYTDDYALLMTARDRGLSGDYLLEPYNSHLMPGSRLLIWLVDSSGPLNWGVAFSITLLLQAAASLACLWMLVTLFGRRWLILIPFTVYLTSAITAQASLWWISSLNQISIQVTFYLAVGAWVRYLRARRLTWLGASTLAVAAGLLFFQKSLLVLPVLIFLALVYFATGTPLRRLSALLRTYWPAALAMGAVAGSYTAYLLTQVEQPFTDRNPGGMLSLAWHMVSTATVGAVGGPWRWEWHEGGAWADTPTPLVVLAFVVVGVVAAYAVLRRRRAGWGWVLLVGYLALQVVLIATSRAPVFGAEIGLAYRLQTDLICVLALSLGLAFAPLVGACQSSEPRTRVPGPAVLVRAVSRSLPPAWVAGGVGVVALSGLVCWTTYALTWHDHNDSGSYLRALDRDLRRQGTTTLADQSVPDSVLPRAFFTAEQRRVSGLVRLLGRSAEYPASSSELALVSGSGELHRALVKPSALARPGPNPNCGWLGLPPAVRVPLTARTLDLDWWVRIGYLSTSTDDVLVTLGDEQVPARIFDGLGNLYVRASGEFESVLISGLDPATKLCVDTIEVGTLTEGPLL